MSRLSAGRATLLNRSIVYSTVSAIITASLIIAFASAVLRMAHQYGVDAFKPPEPVQKRPRRNRGLCFHTACTKAAICFACHCEI